MKLVIISVTRNIAGAGVRAARTIKRFLRHQRATKCAVHLPDAASRRARGDLPLRRRDSPFAVGSATLLVDVARIPKLCWRPNRVEVGPCALTVERRPRA
jgi:hypothetical protein